MHHVAMTESEFEDSVNRALDEVEKAFPGVLDNVAVICELDSHDHPGAIRLGPRGRLLGLFEGVPHTVRTWNEAYVLPDKVTLFSQTISAEAEYLGIAEDQMIREVVWHEIGHLLGLDENRARAVERRKRKNRPLPS